jgi:hypothetical protein
MLLLLPVPGNHHLKVWSFRRPTATTAGSLQYKACTMGKVTDFFG